uniref:Uncharacterized protein n=1 Tax=viral metagenome TaxID=1070528 RepID=A0A6C0AZN6_9ZZZZ
MENVSQENLRYIVKKYFELFRDKDYIDKQVLFIKTMDPNLAHEGGQAGYTTFGMYKDGEIIKTFGNQKESLSFEKDKDTFLNDTIILYIDIKFLVLTGAHEGIRTLFPLKLYNNGVLSVYPGENCPDKNRVTSLELLFDIIAIIYQYTAIMECVDTIKSIIDFKQRITKTLIKTKEIKESDLPETNALNDSIVQLALRYKESQIPQENIMKRSPSRSLRQLKNVDYTAFGATDLKRLTEFYKNNAKEIIAMDNVPFIDILKKPIYLESCAGISRLISDLERIKENMEKALKTVYLILNEEMDKNYQTEPKNYDNSEEFEKEKKKGILPLKEYLQVNMAQYMELNSQTVKIKRDTKSDRKRKGKYLKNITGRVHATVPFAFGKSSKLKQVENEISYLNSI